MKNFEGITKTVIVFLRKPYSIIDKKHWSPQQTLYQAFRIKVPRNYFIVTGYLQQAVGAWDPINSSSYS